MWSLRMIIRVIWLASFVVASTGSAGTESDRRLSIAIVSGYIGDDPAFVPALPHPTYDCYFLTNNVGLGEFAAKSNWKVIRLDHIPIVDSALSAENEMLNSAHSKPLKVHPDWFLPKDYDFIVWFDNKYQLLTDSVLNSIYHWDPAVALMLPPRPECCGADLELKAAMMQPRYSINREKIEKYMEEQTQLGFPVHGARHMRTGFVIHNMKHPDIQLIQDIWQEHIDRAGIMCQIAFYFVAQRFPISVQEYLFDWHTGLRHSLLITYDTNE